MMHEFASARQNYGRGGKQARVLGANAHQLIAILFEELLNLLDDMSEILATNGSNGSNGSNKIYRHQVDAVSILDSLIDSLDEGDGSNIANNLHLIYRHSKALIQSNDPENRMENIWAARRILSEIASAWAQIG